MAIVTYTIERTARKTRTITIDLDSRIYESAMAGKKGARDHICMVVRRKLRLNSFVEWGSFTITPPQNQPPRTCCCSYDGDCTMCDLGCHEQCSRKPR